MMLVIFVYVFMGAAVSVLVVVREETVAGWTGWKAAVVAGPLWPFFLPTIGLANAVAQGARVSDDFEARIAAAQRRAHNAAMQSDFEPRVSTIVDSFALHLVGLNERRNQLREAIEQSPEAVRGRLQELHLETEAEIEAGIDLLDDLTGRVTLVAFSTARDTGSHTHAIDDLVARLESLLETHEVPFASRRSLS